MLKFIGCWPEVADIPLLASSGASNRCCFTKTTQLRKLTNAQSQQAASFSNDAHQLLDADNMIVETCVKDTRWAWLSLTEVVALPFVAHAIKPG